jgi:hypothetical protein
MIRIPLPCGLCAYVSDARAVLVEPYRWRSTRSRRGDNIYVVAEVNLPPAPDGSRRRRFIRMHRLIADPPAHLLVDHWDGDGLNNQDYNLRIATTLQNKGNHGAVATSLTGYRGVTQVSPTRWRAKITIDDECRHLGYASSAEAAARLYDKAARERYGDFARLNFDPLIEAELARRDEAERWRVAIDATF